MRFVLAEVSMWNPGRLNWAVPGGSLQPLSRRTEYRIEIFAKIIHFRSSVTTKRNLYKKIITSQEKRNHGF